MSGDSGNATELGVMLILADGISGVGDGKNCDSSLLRRSGVGRSGKCLSGNLIDVGGVEADLTMEKGAGLAVRGSVEGVSSRFRLKDLKG